MVEERKRRAWHWNKRRMFEVRTIDFSQNRIEGVWTRGNGEETGPLLLDSCELQQFTGDRDMYGEEIYEGDIVDDTCQRIGIPQSTHVVKWNEEDACFCLCDYRGINLPWKPHLLRVIGNRYEDPDILDK